MRRVARTSYSWPREPAGLRADEPNDVTPIVLRRVVNPPVPHLPGFFCSITGKACLICRDELLFMTVSSARRFDGAAEDRLQAVRRDAAGVG